MVSLVKINPYNTTLYLMMKAIENLQLVYFIVSSIEPSPFGESFLTILQLVSRFTMVLFMGNLA